jgi:hypothetical protein
MARKKHKARWHFCNFFGILCKSYGRFDKRNGVAKSVLPLVMAVCAVGTLLCAIGGLLLTMILAACAVCNTLHPAEQPIRTDLELVFFSEKDACNQGLAGKGLVYFKSKRSTR